MPIFEYRCRACGKITEKITRANEQEIKCPSCGGTAEKIISVISAGNVQSGSLHGSGSSKSGCG